MDKRVMQPFFNLITKLVFDFMLREWAPYTHIRGRGCADSGVEVVGEGTTIV